MSLGTALPVSGGGYDVAPRSRVAKHPQCRIETLRAPQNGTPRVLPSVVTTNLGTLGTRVDLSHWYAKGSYQVDVHFTLFGLVFRAQRFVRTDTKVKIDNVDLYIKHESCWYDEHVGRAAGHVDPASPDPRVHRLLTCPAARRALHLIAVAETTSSSDVEARFAAIELD